MSAVDPIPCPFCGSEAIRWHERARCGKENCHASARFVTISEWNTRAKTPEMRAIVRSLREIQEILERYDEPEDKEVAEVVQEVIDNIKASLKDHGVNIPEVG